MPLLYFNTLHIYPRDSIFNFFLNLKNAYNIASSNESYTLEYGIFLHKNYMLLT